MTSYEAWLDTVRGLRKVDSTGQRHVVWAEGGSTIGVCLSPTGQVEILIPGSAFDVTHPAVEARVQHAVWRSQQFGQDVPATKLVLPRGPEFTPAAAWICAELDRHDVASHPGNAFRRIETLIGLVVDGLRSRAEDLVGLLGEIVLLRHLVEEAPYERRVEVVRGWQGYRPSLRDMNLSHLGIEVKTTRREAPVHHFQGIHQVVRSADESSLIIVSIGVDLETDQGKSLDAELGLLSHALWEAMGDDALHAQEMAEFRGLVDRYGVSSSTNLAVDDLQRKMIREKRFEINWLRSYEATSSELGLPSRRGFMALSEHIDADSVSFALALPTANAPYLVSGPRSVARAALEGVGWLEQDGG